MARTNCKVGLFAGALALVLFAAAVIAYTTNFILDWIFDFGYSSSYRLGPLTVPLYIGVIGLFLAFYTLFRRDLAMIALSLLSVLVVFVAGVGRLLWEFMVDTNSIELALYGYFFNGTYHRRSDGRANVYPAAASAALGDGSMSTKIIG